jgi:hypothetical protein
MDIRPLRVGSDWHGSLNFRRDDSEAVPSGHEFYDSRVRHGHASPISRENFRAAPDQPAFVRRAP